MKIQEYNNGFVKIHRKITDWEWYSDHNTTRLFFHLVFTANFKDKNFQGHLVKRGQLITGLDSLSSKIGLSVQQLRTSLKKLKSTGEVTIQATNRFSLITLVNYSLYQGNQLDDNKPDNKQPNKQITNEQQTDNKRITATKEGKESKESKEIIDEQFEEFWNLYDYKKSKPKSLAAYQKSIKADTHGNIIKGVKAYIGSRGQEKQYWKHPTTWLNSQAWLDEYSTSSSKHNNFNQQNYDEGAEGFRTI